MVSEAIRDRKRVPASRPAAGAANAETPCLTREKWGHEKWGQVNYSATE